MPSAKTSKAKTKGAKKSKGKSKKSKAKKESKTQSPAPVVEETKVEQPVKVVLPISDEQPSSSTPVEETKKPVFVPHVSDQTTAILDSIQAQLKSRIEADKKIVRDLTTLRRQHVRERKEWLKFQKKHQKKSRKRGNGGFSKPTAISDEFADFLERKRGELIPRKDATKGVTNYIKSNKLQDPSDGRKILPDKRLGSLLNNGDRPVTYFTLQTFLKPHFLKTETVSS